MTQNSNPLRRAIQTAAYLLVTALLAPRFGRAARADSRSARISLVAKWDSTATLLEAAEFLVG